MDRERIDRRFLTLAAGLGAALAGCADDENGENGTEPESNGTNGRDDGGNEDDKDGKLPNLEGTAISIEVVDAEGTAVPGVTVAVTGGEYDEKEFETDAGGSVVLREIDPDEYTIRATTEDGEDEEGVTLAAGEEASVTLEVPVSTGEGSESGEREEGSEEGDDE